MSLSTPRVHILMGIFDGAAHLPTQLQSLTEQTYANWSLTCSDDGSRDGSRAVVAAFGARAAQQVVLRDGPRAGYSANYMSLIRDLNDGPDLVALADQDDLWLPEKLMRAQESLARVEDGIPALYCSRVLYWAPATDRRVPSPPLRRAPGFRNALIENVAQGNTIVLNPAAVRLARAAARRTGPVFAHDWWLYLLITGAGGVVLHDDRPGLLYRQHDGNAIGSGQGLLAQIRRKRLVLQGAFRDRVGGNIAAMQAVEGMLTSAARAVLHGFAEAREASLGRRLRDIRRIGLYRQSRLSEIGFWGGVVLGRV